MVSFDIWQGIDYLAFHENAILLDMKLRSQGVPITVDLLSMTMRMSNPQDVSPPVGTQCPRRFCPL